MGAGSFFVTHIVSGYFKNKFFALVICCCELFVIMLFGNSHETLLSMLCKHRSSFISLSDCGTTKFKF